MLAEVCLQCEADSEPASCESGTSQLLWDFDLAMGSNLQVVFLFLWLLHHGGGDVSVQQKPLIQVALLKEKVSIPCDVIFPYTLKYTRFTIFYYWINAWDQEVSIYNKKEQVDIPPGEENKTAIKSYSHKTEPLESTSSTGTYYCKVQWDGIQIKGKGVFVLVRGTGYAQTSYGREILITLTTLLAALSITATALLVWKRKILCPKRNQLNIRRQKIGTQPPSASPPPPSPVYDLLSGLCMSPSRSQCQSLAPCPLQCLDSQQVEVYSVLKNNTKIPEHRKSPPDKTPKKQETLEEYSNTLYENI
ncbi:NFAT activation molecule 1 [Numida meleagris]|uniref:NFAT activation molecule 1 n=1 Tax=Numida meleagris TaxID=8996 RepID=UPI000B3DBA72|nr:NFAT activation molecule 1 [Numida meleagris]